MDQKSFEVSSGKAVRKSMKKRRSRTFNSQWSQLSAGEKIDASFISPSGSTGLDSVSSDDKNLASPTLVPLVGAQEKSSLKVMFLFSLLLFRSASLSSLH